MKIKHLYLILAILGFILPTYHFVQFLIENNGFNFTVIFEQLFANRISTFFAYDLTISAITIILFLLYEGKNIKYYWLAILGIVFIGLSFGLPAFLYLREIQKESSSI